VVGGWRVIIFSVRSLSKIERELDKNIL